MLSTVRFRKPNIDGAQFEFETQAGLGQNFDQSELSAAIRTRHLVNKTAIFLSRLSVFSIVSCYSRLKLSFLQKPDIFNAIVRLKSPEFIANEQKEASLWVSSLRQEKFEVAIKILQFSLETEITFAQKNNFAGIY